MISWEIQTWIRHQQCGFAMDMGSLWYPPVSNIAGREIPEFNGHLQIGHHRTDKHSQTYLSLNEQKSTTFLEWTHDLILNRTAFFVTRWVSGWEGGCRSIKMQLATRVDFWDQEHRNHQQPRTIGTTAPHNSDGHPSRDEVTGKGTRGNCTLDGHESADDHLVPLECFFFQTTFCSQN